MKRTPETSASSSVFSSPFRPISKFYAALLQHKILLILALLLQDNISGTEGVIVKSVIVPEAAVVGNHTQLECLWEMGDRDFYSVRWYKDTEQFYSYIKDNTPEKVDHRLPGIHVALASSDRRVVTLREVTLKSEGIYRCEVMSEAPYFQTSFASANLTVVDKPEHPQIYGMRKLYRVGETVNVSCVVRDAKPPASIDFEINGNHVSRDSGRVTYFNVEEGSHRGIYSSRSQLIFPASRQYVPKLTVKCRASIPTYQVEETLEAHVEPVITSMFSLFNAGAPSGYLSSLNVLMVALALSIVLGVVTAFV